MNIHSEIGRHTRLGPYLKDIVFAANDGIVTTFAVIAGTVGAALPHPVVLIIGFASLLADGVSMAAGNYLGTKSEIDLYRLEEKREQEEVKSVPDEEKAEIRQVLARKGFAGDRLERMVETISGNEKYWVDFMLREELELTLPESENPGRNALATFFSFVIAGGLPLFSYLVIGGSGSFTAAAVFSAAALFTVGALRKYFSGRSWWKSGLEMLLIGGSAGLIAYLVGFVLKSLLA